MKRWEKTLNKLLKVGNETSERLFDIQCAASFASYKMAIGKDAQMSDAIQHLEKANAILKTLQEQD